MHACMCIYIHTYMPTYINTYIHTHRDRCIDKFKKKKKIGQPYFEVIGDTNCDLEMSSQKTSVITS